MPPLMVFRPVLLPVSVSVLLPAPVAVKALVKVIVAVGAVPEASSVAPPVVPARLRTRSVVEAVLPTYCRLAPVVVAPRAMVALPTGGAPRLLLLPALAREATLSTPALIVVAPVKLLVVDVSAQ